MDSVTFSTNDVEHARVEVGRILSPHRLTPQADHVVTLRLAARKLGDVGVVDLDYGGPVRVQPEPLSSFYLVQMPYCGSGVVRHAGRSVFATAETAVVISPQEPFEKEWSAGTPHRLFYVQRSSVEREPSGCWDTRRRSRYGSSSAHPPPRRRRVHGDAGSTSSLRNSPTPGTPPCSTTRRSPVVSRRHWSGSCWSPTGTTTATNCPPRQRTGLRVGSSGAPAPSSRTTTPSLSPWAMSPRRWQSVCGRSRRPSAVNSTALRWHTCGRADSTPFVANCAPPNTGHR